MASIDSIDYDALISGASTIASYANDMQTNIKQAFEKIDSMREVWFGNSYDNFINSVNMSILPLNDIFSTTVSDIPHEIAAKAKSYAASQQTSVGATFTDQTAIMLSEVSKTNKGSELRFQSDKVSSVQQEINSALNNAKTNAEFAMRTSENLKPAWQSISGDNNITELKLGFSKVMDIINNLTNSLSEAISAQAGSIELIESAAGGVEAAKDIVTDGIENARDMIGNFADAARNAGDQVWKNLTGKN